MNVKEASEFMVSIRLMTYNHDYFIEEAMRGIDMQQTNFNFEVVFGDDFSTDQTLFKIKNFQFTNPKLNVNILNRKKGDSYDVLRQEKGRLFNFIDIINNCKGKYIALLDGDDYWSDPLKLQKQVDFLDANPQYVIHSGAAKICRNEKLMDEYIGLGEKDQIFGLENFYGQNNLVTSTVLFKSGLGVWPNEYNTIIFGDWFLYIMLLHQTKLKAYRSAEVFAVYRIHDKGVMKTLLSININKQQINQILSIKKYIGYKRYPPSVIKWINNYSIPKFRYELSHKMYRDALQTFMVNVYYCKFNISLHRYLGVFKHNLKIFR
jgi:glycosyltransferase involved in cell wall biosynthesis